MQARGCRFESGRLHHSTRPERCSGLGSPAQFIGSSSTDPDGDNIVSYEWSFGDGIAQAGPFSLVDTDYTYSAPGRYEVRLKLKDDLTPEPATGIGRVFVRVVQ